MEMLKVAFGAICFALKRWKCSKLTLPPQNTIQAAGYEFLVAFSLTRKLIQPAGYDLLVAFSRTQQARIA